MHTPRQNPATVRGFVVLGLAGALRQVDHAGDLADQLDLDASLVAGRMDHHRFDEGAQNLRRLGPRLGAGEGFMQVLDLPAIKFGEVRMEPRQRRRRSGNLAPDFRLAAFELVELLLQVGALHSAYDRVDQRTRLLVDLREFPLCLLSFQLAGPPALVLFGMIGGDEFRHELGCHQPLAQAAENQLLKLVMRNTAPVAAATVSLGTGAGEGQVPGRGVAG